MAIVSAASTAKLNITPTVVQPDRFNPSDVGTNVELLHDFKTTNTTASTSGFVRTNTGKSSGKYYFEISWENAQIGTGSVGCGLVQDSLANTSNTYTTNQAWAVWGRNAGARHNSVNAHSFASEASERWGFAVDLDAGELWIWDHNASAWLQGDPEAGTSPTWSNLSGTLHPYAQPWYHTGSGSPEVTIHTSYKSLSRAVPDGFIAGWPSGDPYFSSVVLLLPFDGTDGDTTTTDFSSSAHTLTFNSTAQIDDAQAKFGSTSLWCDGNSDYVTTPSSSDFEFGTGDFTIETWVRFSTVSGTRTLISNYVSGGVHGFSLQWRADGGARWTFYYGDTQLMSWSATPSADQWYHVAVARSGTSLKLFIDGVERDSVTNSTNMSSTALLTMGKISSLNIQYFHGWLDDVRITKGVARYTAAFTPPTQAHPLS